MQEKSRKGRFFLVYWTLRSRYSDECLEVNSVFVAEVFDHLGWKEFGRRADTVGFQESTVRLQPTAEGLRAHPRCAGKLNFCSGLHKDYEF